MTTTSRAVCGNRISMYQILTDHLRSTCGMQPIGPEGWTKEELLAYEAKRRELMLRPIIAVEGAFTGDQISEWEKSPGHITFLPNPIGSSKG